MSTGSLPLGTRLGRYTIVAHLGTGGMGAVYRAQDPAGGTFALKVIKTGTGIEERLLRRFQREAHAAALVDHPNVCKVVEAGEQDGVPFLVLEHVPGGSVEALLGTRGPLAWKDAATLGAQIARGLGAIHAAGLVHRDLKPANVLLDSEGRAKLTDFGLVRGDAASALSRGTLTKTGELLGTLEYMAPEQTGDAAKVDARADLYALGATLYCLLTGEPPFPGVGYELVIRHLTQAPVPPRQLAPDIPDALEALVLLLLEKAPDARPQRADLVAADLEALAAGRAPRSRRRSRLILVGAVVVASILAGGAVLLSLPGGSPPPPPPPRPDPPRPPPPAAPAFPKRCDGFLSTKMTKLAAVLGEPVRRMPDIPYGGFAVTRDGKRVLCAGGKRVTLWELATPDPVVSVDLPLAVNAIALSPDDRRAIAATGESALFEIDLESGRSRSFAVPSKDRASVAYLEDRRVLSAGSDGRALLTDLALGDSREAFPADGKEDVSFVLTPDRKRAFFACRDGSSRLVNVGTGAQIWDARGHGQATIYSLAVAADGKFGATGATDTTIALWDLDAGKTLGRLEGHGAAPWGIAIAPDRRILSCSDDWTIRVWEPRGWTGQMLPGMRAVPYIRCAMTPDGKQGIVVSEDCVVRIFDLLPFPRERRAGHGAAVTAIAAARGSTRVVSADDFGRALVWDTKTGKELAALDPRSYRPLEGVAISRGGARALTAGNGDHGRIWFAQDSLAPVALWDLDRGREITRLGDPGSRATAVAFSPDGRRAFLFAHDRTGKAAVECWEIEPTSRTWACPVARIVKSLSVSENGATLLADHDDGSCSTIDVGAGTAQARPAPAPGSHLLARSLGERARSLYAKDREAFIEALPVGRVALSGSSGKLLGGALSADGSLAITGSDDAAIRLWDASSGALLDTITLASSKDVPIALDFEPGGRSFLAGTSRGVILRFELVR